MTSDDSPRRWQLTLYVSGASPCSAAAVETARRICDEELLGQVDLQVLDIRDARGQAVDDGIVAVPTLVKRMPEPLRKLVGNLSDVLQVRVALDIPPAIAGNPWPAIACDIPPAPGDIEGEGL